MVVLTEEMAAALARGATVLTGRPRAARALRQAIDRAKRAEGASSWEPPRVFAWDSWTAGLWRDMLLRGEVSQMLLNRTQEMAVWRVVIEDDPAGASLRSVTSLAALAAGAWGELARHEGLGRLAGSPGNSDMEAFARWAAAFQQRCRERGYLAQARLEGALRRVWRQRGNQAAEREVLLAGFDRMVPAQAALLDDLRAAGCLVTAEAGDGELPAARVLLAAEDEASEIREAARWAQEFLEERPSATVGVLLPGLSASPKLRAAIDRVFRDVLAPEAQAVGAGVGRLPYEFSTGVSLGQTAAGRAALAILRWADEPLEVDAVGELMRSRHFAEGAERAGRAEFDAYRLRKRRRLLPEVGLAEAIGMLDGERLPGMSSCLRRLQVTAGRWGNGPRGYAEWAESMREALAAAGWTAGEDSAGFQVREAWESALDELATLDFEGSRAVYGRACEALEAIAAQTTFAPEAWGAPVQVMGPEEAAGLHFDAIWMMRAGDRTWPGPVAGSSLVAWPLRRELGMPGTDATLDMAQARRVSQRIARGAGEAVFSYARQGADGQQRASAALSGLGLHEITAAGQPEEEAVEPLEVVEDTAAVGPLPDRVISGGVGVLKAQAACAFHAFAEYRLFATEMDPAEPGLNASERGQAVHGMLERFWAAVETQASLLAMSADDRGTALGQAIDDTFASMHVTPASDWELAYVQAQRDRLLRLGEAWLDLEARRETPFRVVRQEEALADLAVGPLRLSVRLDRIDATAEGTVLIDYKTGIAAPSGWLGERPDEPQIPLYAAIAEGGRLHAVAFGQVRAGDEMKLTGYATGPGTLKPAKMETESLAQQVEAWRDVVVGLAAQFARGDTRVSPKVYPGTCQYCAHRLICRLDVPSLDALDDDAEEDFG